jgi:beta-hydroxylase
MPGAEQEAPAAGIEALARSEASGHQISNAKNPARAGCGIYLRPPAARVSRGDGVKHVCASKSKRPLQIRPFRGNNAATVSIGGWLRVVVDRLLAPPLLVLYALAISALIVHFRGRERLRFGRQIWDHSTYLAPYNVLMYAFSAVPNKPVLTTEHFPELKVLRDNWGTIRDEAVTLFDEGHLRAAIKNNDWGFYSFFKSGWKRFYLKWYEDFLPSAQTLCPRTVELLKQVPNIHGAMFAVLPPGAKLGRHRDPFAGSIRYHLGLVTPNSNKCRIVVDGVECVYRDGEDFLFDETFIHTAENATDQKRIILLCDIERPMKLTLMARINHWVSETIIKASTTNNVEGERVGAINRAFSYLYELHRAGQRVKQWNRRVYYTLKYGVVLTLLAVIVFASI